MRSFDPARAGVVAVWTDPADGKTYVVNGHHRYELARRTGQKTINVLYLEDAKTAAEARSRGALINISEGRGTALDTAKFFRDTGMTAEQLKDQGASLSEGKITDGLALSRLSPTMFNRVANGEMAEGRGIAIGQVLPDHAAQEALHALLLKQEQKGRSLANDEIGELARFVQQSSTTTETQASLFGEETVTRNLAVEKARLSAWVKRQIRRDKKLFGTVARSANAESLGRGGNVINQEQSRTIADDAAMAEFSYNALSTKVGPVSDSLNSAARELASGKDFDAVTQALYPKIRENLSQVVADPGQTGSGGFRPHPEDTGRGAAPERAVSQSELSPAASAGKQSGKSVDQGQPPAPSRVLPTWETLTMARGTVAVCG